ncbi:MAG: IDEAL domain-containing protein [Alicyclobacillus sp.]|nr:IDEAL domain-containing protein [Alicyclobacillus sp.]
MTHIVLENVPLLIIGRHGMIARIPVGGVVQKVSQPNDIMELLQTFFQRQDKLYLFVNLPDLPVPAEVAELLKEVQSRADRKEQLRKEIDSALDRRDEAAFMRASSELRRLQQADVLDDGTPRRFLTS